MPDITELEKKNQGTSAAYANNGYGAPPDGKWGDLAALEKVRDYKARHASTLLVFDAVEDAIAQIEAEREAASRAEAHV